MALNADFPDAAMQTPDEGEGLDDESRTAVIRTLLDTAIAYVDDELSPERAAATDYYNGAPFGNEEQGRSQVVSTDVRDTILGIMPDALRVFFGPEGCVEFVAQTAEREAEAKQATAYINHIFRNDNRGFLLTHSVLKDGWLKKLGIAKVWWEEKVTKEVFPASGLTGEEIQLLEAEEYVTLSDMEQEPAASPDEPPTYKATVTKVCKDGRIRVVEVPPEELVFNRSARDKDHATIIAHRRKAMKYELVEMGFDEEDLEGAGTGGPNKLDLNPEEIARNPKASTLQHDAETVDESTHAIQFCEAYIRLEGELRRFYTVGENHKLVSRADADGTYPDPETGEEVDEAPFVLYTPDPEPHTILGTSQYDITKDIQLIKSNVLRSTLDSLNLSLHPRTWAVLGQADVKDVLNTEIGAIIRLKQPGMVGEFAHTFVGKEAFPMLGYLDDMKEQRTARSKASAGLDPDALQSSTKEAVNATIGGSQARSELLCRIFAETFYKDLFRMMLKLTKQHQDRPRTLRLNGRYVEVDPRMWDAEMDVQIIVALGGGTTTEKIQNLLMIKATQEQIMSQLGPNNPLVSLAQYRSTLARLVELQGFPNAEEFFKPFSEQDAQKAQQAAQAQPPQPSPEMVIAQSQVQATQAELQIKQAEFQLKQQESQMQMAQQQFENQLAEEKLRQEMILRSREMELKYNADINEAQMQNAIEGNKLALQATSEQHKAEMKSALEEHKANLKAQVDTHKNELMADAHVRAAAARPAPGEA